MRCEKCGNKIRELFIYKDGNYICRKCLMYKERTSEMVFKKGKGEYKLNYSLTEEQKEASEFVLNMIKNKKDCVLNAVTGAGKTEIIYPLVKYCIDNNLKIGITIARKDVVIELTKRIENDFKQASVISVYGGCNDVLYADVIILTCHQLYRYKQYFDVIVIDEVDAFPFYNNDLLKTFLKNSVKGNIVYMSATMPKELLKDNEVYYLNKRYHGNKLDIPKLKYLWSKKTIYKYIKKHDQSMIIIYFPTIKQQMEFSKKFKIKHYLINSKVSDRKELLLKLHTLEKGVILSTLVLERGVTFKNTNVIVYNADHPLFSYENLVQISGRVGRHYLFPHGDIIFLINNKNKRIKQAIKFIKKCNE